MTRVLPFLLTLALAVMPRANAQTPELSAFEPVLIPILGVHGGAFGARFASSFGAIGPYGFTYYASGGFQQYAGDTSLGLSAPDGPPARVLWVDRDDAERVWYHASLFTSDATRLHDSVTLVPVVREHQFVRGRVILHPVPAGAAYRHRIRIYTLGPEPAGFRIGVCAMALGPFEDGCRGEDLRLTTLPPVEGDPTKPAYVEADVTESFDCIVVSPHSGCLDLARFVSVEADDPDRPYWVMISATENATQQVRLFVPQ